LSNVQVKITTDKEMTPDQKKQLEQIADYTARRARFVLIEDQEKNS